MIHMLAPTEAEDRFTCNVIGHDRVPWSAWAPEGVRVPEALLPLRLRRTSDSRHVQHFAEGPREGGQPVPGTRLVSTAFRDLIEEFDPGANAFEPVEIVMDVGEAVRGEFWLLKTGRVVEAVALDPKWSDLAEVHDGAGRVVGHVRRGFQEVLFLEGAAFEGLDFWRDANLLGTHFCSDRFRRAIRRRRLEPVRSCDWLRHVDEGHPLNEREF